MLKDLASDALAALLPADLAIDLVVELALLFLADLAVSSSPSSAFSSFYYSSSSPSPSFSSYSTSGTSSSGS